MDKFFNDLASSKTPRDKLIASIPFLPTERVRRIASDAARTKEVRDLMMAEITRRNARARSGKPVVIRALPRGGIIPAIKSVSDERVKSFIRKYKTPTKAITSVVNRPPARAPARPSPVIPTTNAARRAQEAAAARKAAYDAAHPIRTSRQARGLPVLSKAVIAQREARRAAGLKVLSASQRREFEARRGNLRGEEDMLGALMGETDPTIGQAVMSHPFQALLIGTALFEEMPYDRSAQPPGSRREVVDRGLQLNGGRRGEEDGRHQGHQR